MKNLLRRKGFTLIELIVVVFIIAVALSIFASCAGCQGESRAGKNLSKISTEYDGNGNPEYNVIHYKDLNTGQCWKSVAGNSIAIEPDVCSDAPASTPAASNPPANSSGQ